MRHPQTAGPAAEGRAPRPFALVVLAAIMLFKGMLIFIVVLSSAGSDAKRLPEALRIDSIATAVAATPLALAGLVLMGVLLLLSAVGLLAYRRSGWLIGMILTGLFILFDIIGFLAGTANYLWMFLNIVTVFYLNQREVRESLGIVGELIPATEPPGGLG
jgi:uncharacterized membrane protein (DUF2068 family)